MTVTRELMNHAGGVIQRKIITVRDLNEAVHAGTQWITGNAPATGEQWQGGVLPASFVVREIDARGIAGDVLHGSRTAA